MSNMLPVPKPKKDEGPLKNLRPINPLNSIRKIFSIITLNRINEKVDGYLPASQEAYRSGRSTGDIIWTQKFVTAKAQTYQDVKVNIIGINMSSKFDTNHVRQELETLLDEDE